MPENHNIGHKPPVLHLNIHHIETNIHQKTYNELLLKSII